MKPKTNKNLFLSIPVTVSLIFSSSVYSQTPTQSQSEQPTAAKGGSSTGIGGGGDVLLIPGKGKFTFDEVEQTEFHPSELSEYQAFLDQLSLIEKLVPGVAAQLRKQITGSGAVWFFALGELKQITDEKSENSAIKIGTQQEIEQAAYFKNGTIVLRKSIYEELNPKSRLSLLMHEAIRAAFFESNHVEPEVRSLRELTSSLTSQSINKYDIEKYWSQRLLKTFLNAFQTDQEFLTAGLNNPSRLEPQTERLNKLARVYDNAFFLAFLDTPPNECPHCQKISHDIKTELLYAKLVHSLETPELSSKFIAQVLDRNVEKVKMETDIQLIELEKTLNAKTTPSDVDDKSFRFAKLDLLSFQQDETTALLRRFKVSFHPIEYLNEKAKSQYDQSKMPLRVLAGLYRYGGETVQKIGLVYILFDTSNHRFYAFVSNAEAKAFNNNEEAKHLLIFLRNRGLKPAESRTISDLYTETNRNLNLYFYNNGDFNQNLLPFVDSDTRLSDNPFLDTIDGKTEVARVNYVVTFERLWEKEKKQTGTASTEIYKEIEETLKRNSTPSHGDGLIFFTCSGDPKYSLVQYGFADPTTRGFRLHNKWQGFPSKETQIK